MKSDSDSEDNEIIIQTQEVHQYNQNQNNISFAPWQKSEVRGYEWTFKKPTEVQLNVECIQELSKLLVQEILEQKQPEFPEGLGNEKDKKDEIMGDKELKKVDVQQIKQVCEEVKQEVETKRKSKLVKDFDNIEYAQLNLEIPNIYESDVYVSKQSLVYKPDIINLCGGKYLTFTNNYQILLDEITKIKIYAEVAVHKTCKLKISHFKFPIFLGVDLTRQIYELPEHYIWFAKIINSKLVRQGHDLKKLTDEIRQRKPIGPNDGSIIQGEIYKRSQYKRKWEKRHIVINTEGLFSYKTKSQNYTFNVPISDPTELWTRFDYHNRYLVIKLLHNSTKTEFAIPIQDFCQRTNENWLYSFYRLLMQHIVNIKY